MFEYLNKKIFYFILGMLAFSSCSDDPDLQLCREIRSNEQLSYVQNLAEEIVSGGFNAGDGYGEVWIRDYNTFIELSCTLHEHETIKENLRVFFRLQGEDGNIIDGFIPKKKAGTGYDYRYSDLEPDYAGHKNTVETDQESSLIQAVYKYVSITGDKQFLFEKIDDVSIIDRLEMALEYLMKDRFNEEYGLLFGATTADWGDVQPEHDWGVFITEDTHFAIDVYDNSMFIIALSNFMYLLDNQNEKWIKVKESIEANVRKYLWNDSLQKFIPHIYINGSPFPESLDEDKIFYHGGTAVAIEAGLLDKQEIEISIEKMIENVLESGAGSIGLTVYPPYPEGSFKGKGMYPYGYQNGGDWTWFGGRMIQQMISYGFMQEAYTQLLPMVERVVENEGFYEWYSIDNEPKGSGTFRGSAGVLHKAVDMLYHECEIIEKQVR